MCEVKEFRAEYFFLIALDRLTNIFRQPLSLVGQPLPPPWCYLQFWWGCAPSCHPACCDIVSLAEVKASNIHYSPLICGAACPNTEQGGQVSFALAHARWILLSLTSLDTTPMRLFSLVMLGCGQPDDPQILPLLKADVIFALFFPPDIRNILMASSCYGLSEIRESSL